MGFFLLKCLFLTIVPILIFSIFNQLTNIILLSITRQMGWELYSILEKDAESVKAIRFDPWYFNLSDYPVFNH